MHLPAIVLIGGTALSASPPDPPFLKAFVSAPVGQRLHALGHVPAGAWAVAPGEWVVAIRAPEQSLTSNWDDETRLVLYRRGPSDFERIQFVSKAGRSIPGDLALLGVVDLDGDGVREIWAVGKPHGLVGKATVMVFRRERAGGTFHPVFRRRHVKAQLAWPKAGTLTLSYEKPAGTQRREAFTWRGQELVSADGQAVPVSWE